MGERRWSRTAYADELTERQMQVLALIARGRTNAEIAEELDISLDGAKYHVREILAKLGVESREEAAEIWRREQGLGRRLIRLPAAVAGLPIRAWAGVAAGAAGVGILVVAAGLLLLSNDEPGGNSPPAGTPGDDPSTGTPVAAVPRCPVDQEICDFAREREQLLVRGELLAFTTPSPWQRAGGLSQLFDRINAALPQPATPRLVSIGCPVVGSPPEASCASAFALVFATADRASLGESGPGILELLFQRGVEGSNDLRALPIPEGADRLAAFSGVGSSGCRDFQVAQLGWCTQIAWYPVEAPHHMTTEQVDGVDVIPLRLGADAQLPVGVRVLVVTGSYASDAQPTGWRVFETRAGGLEIDDIVTRFHEGTGIPDKPYAITFGERLGEVVASVCLGDFCGPAAGQFAASSRAYVSHDGGVTWAFAGDLPPLSVVFAASPAATLVATLRQDSDHVDRWWILETGETFGPPVSDTWPVYVQGVGLAWRDLVFDGRTFDGAGNLVYSVPAGAEGYREVIARLPSGALFVRWSLPAAADGSPGGSYLARVAPGGQTEAIWSWNETEVFWPRAVVGADLLLANVLVSPRSQPGPDGRLFELEAALVDLRTGLIHPLRDLSRGMTGNENPFVWRVVLGPTFRVTGTGDCLNVRSDPTTESTSLGCYRDGVVLGDRREAHVEGGIGGREWAGVITPTGEEGWAVREYLSR